MNINPTDPASSTTGKSPSTRTCQSKYTKISATGHDSASIHNALIAKNNQLSSPISISPTISSHSKLSKPNPKRAVLSPEDQIHFEAEEVDLTCSDTESQSNAPPPSSQIPPSPLTTNKPSCAVIPVPTISDSDSQTSINPCLMNSNLSTSSPFMTPFSTALTTTGTSSLSTSSHLDTDGSSSLIVKNKGESYFRHAPKNINNIKPSSIKISDWIDLENTGYLLVRALKVKTDGTPTPAGTKRHERSLYVVGRVDDCFLDKRSSVNEKDTPTWTISLDISMDSYKSLKAITGMSPNPVKVNSKSEPIQVFYPFNMFREKCSVKFRQKITRFTVKSSESAKDRFASEGDNFTNNSEPDIDYINAPFPSIYDSAHLSINPRCSLQELVLTSHLNLLPKSLAAVEFTITYWTFTLKTGYLKQGYSFWLQSVHHLNNSSAHIVNLQPVQPSIDGGPNRSQFGPNRVVERTITKRRFLDLDDLDRE